MAPATSGERFPSRGARAARRLACALAVGCAGVAARGQEAAQTWPFMISHDAYKSDALLDLRGMNERVAGETGFVRLSADGNSFVRGDGAPIRFWSAVSDGATMRPEEMEAHCDFLAKRGVNMVRLHLSLCNTKEGAAITDVNEQLLDGAFRFIAAAKKRGIYVTLSPYWAAARPPKSWGIEDYDGLPMWGLLFFNPKLQAAHRAWVTEIYTRRNPYTGVPLKDEPAVAIAQTQNEDSVLFWTFQGVHGAQRAMAERLFTAWAAKKYGSVGQARAAWGGAAVKGDTGDTLALDMIWQLTQDPPSNHGKRQRLADQTEFLATLQHDFNAGVEAHMRSIGCKQLTNAENWRTADAVRLNDAERWTYTPNDVSAVNAYVGGLHVGKNNGFRIDPGHFYTDVSVLKNPETLPASIKQTVGHPMLITEVAWTQPNLYQSEGPFMMAAYLSLTGVGSAYWFDANRPGWLEDPRKKFWPVGGSFAVDKWSISTPMGIGQFPAASIAFRHGYVRRGDVVVHEERRLADLWERRVPVISEAGRFDPNRDAGAFAPDSKVKQEVDRLAFLVGPVEAAYGGDPAKTAVAADLPKFIDRDAGTVRSNTGEVYLDYRRGVMVVSAPKYQGVCGFLKGAGGGFQTADMRLASGTEYAAIAAVAMDDAPLATSGNILVQVGTTARLTGYQSRPAKFKPEEKAGEVEGLEIVDTGAPPWRVGKIDATLSVRNAKVAKATLLDLNGYAFGDVPVSRDGEWASVKLPAETMYLVLH